MENSEAQQHSNRLQLLKNIEETLLISQLFSDSHEDTGVEFSPLDCLSSVEQKKGLQKLLSEVVSMPKLRYQQSEQLFRKFQCSPNYQSPRAKNSLEDTKSKIRQRDSSNSVTKNQNQGFQGEEDAETISELEEQIEVENGTHRNILNKGIQMEGFEREVSKKEMAFIESYFQSAKSRPVAKGKSGVFSDCLC